MESLNREIALFERFIVAAPDSAKGLLGRVRELRERHNRGSILPEERAEMEAFARAGALLGELQSKAQGTSSKATGYPAPPCADDPREREMIRADLKLQASFPGEHVAYVDEWTGVDDQVQLLRSVLAHSRSHAEMCDQIAKLRTLQPDDLCDTSIQYVFIDDPTVLTPPLDLAG